MVNSYKPNSKASWSRESKSLPPDFDSSLSFVPPESDVACKKTWRLKLSRIRSVMHSLDVKRAVGPDGVSPHILKHCCAELSHPICILFHRVYKSGQFPPSWKVSRITPVQKVLSPIQSSIVQ